MNSNKPLQMTMLDERHLSDDELKERLKELEREIKQINLSTIEASEEDLYDEWCDPKNLRVLKFEEIAAAAYRIKCGVEKTPCPLSHMSGNHALAMCFHGRKLGIPVVVVMPHHAPIMKVNNCKSLGAVIIVKGQDLGESKRVALKFDHPHILAGQGSMGLEILDQVPDVDAIIIPTGGGGLLAGTAVAVKSVNPRVLIIAAESERSPSFFQAMKAGRPVVTECLPTLADGLSVPLVGSNAFATSSSLVDKVVTVSEEFIALAILRLLEMEKAVVEGAGATGFAAVLQGLVPELIGKKVVIPLCGGNIDTTVLGRVLERGLVADDRLLKVWVTVSDRPGSLHQLCKLFHGSGASVKDIYHERAWLKSDMFSVQIQVILEVRDREHAKELSDLIRANYDQVKFFDH
ncbi:unnamed protein product [Didymodactylos carnosus]|uniref:L-serine deaminase n=1 Tax=Didymodactylos carnosus TaxID=1234261 RepID=A0A814BQC4_9BILA|nr:unnamed protein product [Didymodactylos carnosus]CAF1213268.1 unnamed protein product [Didymodactylos carnosus]CAF3710754.1 unnamed protein product [Didymodactylos carnosus]CAF4022105.1 unnamed protein product [Didymodactylos carnosus]